MTDMRERVARAILETDPTCDYDGCKKRVESGVFGQSDRDWWENTLHGQADAALLACGYAEMRKALEDIILAADSEAASGGEMFYAETVSGPIDAARSILERTK
jgi:hypothetical protein